MTSISVSSLRMLTRVKTKMEERSICLRAPLLAEADTENNMNSITKVSSVADADTVINTNNTNSSQTKGDRGEGELLEELLTDSYCHVCEAVLLFESQRLSHYEGKRHAQKLRMYLQAKRDEKRNKDPTGLQQRSMTTDKDRFCELCSMVFSSPVVARSHYEGKVHAKNLRRHGLPPSTPPADVPSQNGPQMTLPAPTNPIPVASNPKPSEEEVHKGPPQDPPASTDVDLSDPDRHCRLCAASFNNPVMALQHYNGRKHQRNHARQRLLQELGDDHVQANHFSCPICSIELNSVEMYQAHMQGNKHQVKEKKVVDLCKSQKKTYDSFTDELADYIQVQKARGLSPKTGRGPNEADEHDQGEDEEEADDGRGDGGPELSAAPPTAAPHPASLYPPAGWRPLYQAPPTAAFGFAGNALAWAHAFPPLPPQPLLPGHTPPRLPGRPPLRRRRRDSSSSSYSSSSSSSSSYTSSSSDSDHRHRKRKRTKSRRERGRKSAREEEDGDQEETRRRRRGRGVRDDSEGRRGREEDEEEDGRRKRQGKSGGRGEKRPQEGEEEEEEDGARRAGRGGGGGEETEEKKEEDSGPSRPKHRREKRKTREKVDTRTEEEKLWDESILGL